MAFSANSLGLAHFAFNIYGSMPYIDTPRPSEPVRHLSPAPKSLVYSADRELTAIAQFSHPLGRLHSSGYDRSSFVSSLHVVLGGKNFLKLLVLNREQSALVADLNLVDPNPNLRLQLIPKFFNVSTIKCNADLIACGLTNGNVHIFQVAGNGKSKLAYRLDDHKRVINSLDFIEQEKLFLSGSQDGSIRLCDLRLNNQKPAIKLLASQHSDPVRSCQYSQHHKVRGKLTILSVHDSGSLCKFDLRYPSSAVKSALPEWKATFHTGPALSLDIHPELEYALTGGRDGKICLWNYGESLANAKSPESIMNTYGPVMKIRWCDTPNSEPQLAFPGHAGEETESRSSALYNYDFACLYLNDDPTVTIYNLARRYVPKEIISTSSKKPIQNFSWARDYNGDRRLWTILKANNFVSYNLDRPNDLLFNILRTHENLPVAATAWAEGYANISFVAQNPDDYNTCAADQEHADLDDALAEEEPPQERMPIARSVSNFTEGFNVFSRPFLKSVSTLPHLGTSAAMSPKEKPQATWSGSQFNPGTKLASPVLFNRQSATEISSVMSPMRPSLKKTPSQSTIESVALSTNYTQPLGSRNALNSRKTWNAISPCLVTLKMPIELSDDAVFAALASNYLFSVPNGFSVSFVCQLNAQAAVAVDRLRESKMWSLLAVALEQELPQGSMQLTELALLQIDIGAATDYAAALDDMKSFCSELDNFVASYNSTSTPTTNYGGAKSNASATSMTKALLSTLKSSSHLEGFSPARKRVPKTSETGTYNSNAKPQLFFGEMTETRLEKVPPAQSDKETVHSPVKVKKLIVQTLPAEPPVGQPPVEEPKALLVPETIVHHLRHKKSFSKLLSSASPVLPSLSNSFAAPPHPDSGSPGSEVGMSHGTYVSEKRKLATQTRPHTYLSNSNNSSFGSLPVPFADEFSALNHAKPSLVPLDRVDEGSLRCTEAVASELTRAINRVAQKTESRRPWHSLNLISKALHFAIDEGDLVTAATLILLFADMYRGEFSASVLTEDQCLECLGTYIDALRKKELYSVAVNVVKEAPRNIRYRIDLYASKEVDMKFYCCWCQKLLVNEHSKSLLGATNENYGYWYCDECRRKQQNCVYCNEPCKGLAVVVDLGCGHRGHFGCLKEWFVEEKNTDCPGGCEK